MGVRTLDGKHGFPLPDPVTVMQCIDQEIARIISTAPDNGKGLINTTEYTIIPAENLHENPGIIASPKQDFPRPVEVVVSVKSLFNPLNRNRKYIS